MAGLLVPIVPYRFVDFGFLSVGASVDIPLRTGIDIRDWRAAGLQVRVASISMGSGSITFGIMREAPTDEDPGALFVDTNNLWASATITSSTAAPSFAVSTTFFSGVPLGPAIRVIARGMRTVSGASVSALVSVDLCLKNGNLPSQ